ncbi:MAG: Maf family protein [Ilumatobacter sp.]|uniref:Maf family protein n=1 Tax=Ilumatobacter sp. TaxID=1967498 RepID=UPI00262A4FF4|nr:Maf family protein [Ilumatobacter sp.]MDJ0770719.1 Maf family protein [Ilumatobacter sp.]
MPTSLVLASSSPRRHQLLRSIGLDFEVVAADVDETRRDGEPPLDYVTRIAESKALAVVNRMGIAAAGDVAVLAADTTVDVDGEVFGKPADDADARRMLEQLSGRTHRVHTAIVGWRMTGMHRALATTDVTFVDLDAAAIDWYLSIGEHRDKAGAYGMQDAAGAFVERVDGSPTNVIGLPLAQTIAVLRACGIEAASG